jgi:hypothetical protein
VPHYWNTKTEDFRLTDKGKVAFQTFPFNFISLIARQGQVAAIVLAYAIGSISKY